MHVFFILNSLITIITIINSDQAEPSSHDEASAKKLIFIIQINPRFTIIRNAFIDFNRLTISKVVGGAGIH